MITQSYNHLAWNIRPNAGQFQLTIRNSATAHMMNSFCWQTEDATPPMVNHGLRTVWPPVTEQPASLAQSLKPLRRIGTTVSRSFSVIFVETPTWCWESMVNVRD